jgi:hypothetical protein
MFDARRGAHPQRESVRNVLKKNFLPGEQSAFLSFLLDKLVDSIRRTFYDTPILLYIPIDMDIFIGIWVKALVYIERIRIGIL